MSIENPSFDQRNKQEKYGANVEILLKVMRHGERGKDGALLDVGRELTRDKAESSSIKSDDFDAVKAIGSDAGPKGPLGVGRAMETADIYAHAIAGDEAFQSRISQDLSYEGLKNKVPFDWQTLYDSYLPDDFENLPTQEKIKASAIAQAGIFDYFFNLQTPEADAYIQETAGAVAYVLEHYQAMAKRLNSGSKVLIPAGTHGGLMEFLLQQAMVTKDKDGNKKVGINSIAEIGGEFSPSDSYNLDIQTDNQGNLKQVVVTFDNPERPQLELSLDGDKVTELAEHYKKLHELK
jgi:hypothetical protein